VNRQADSMKSTGIMQLTKVPSSPSFLHPGKQAMSVTSDSLTVDQIMVHFSTDEVARRYLETVRWPNGPVCPHCSNADSERIYDIAANPAKKIRYALRDPVFADKLGGDGGAVAADEAYVGGNTKGKGRAYKGIREIRHRYVTAMMSGTQK
jgi:transposase-like zinc ribbon protein